MELCTARAYLDPERWEKGLRNAQDEEQDGFIPPKALCPSTSLGLGDRLARNAFLLIPSTCHLAPGLFLSPLKCHLLQEAPANL